MKILRQVEIVIIYMPLVFGHAMLSFGQNKKKMKSTKALRTLPGHASMINIKGFIFFGYDFLSLTIHWSEVSSFHWGVVDYYSNYDNVQRFWTFYEWKRRYINSNYYYYYWQVSNLSNIF